MQAKHAVTLASAVWKAILERGLKGFGLRGCGLQHERLRLGGLPIQFDASAILNHGRQVPTTLQHADVGQGIGGHQNEISELARFEYPHLAFEPYGKGRVSGASRDGFKRCVAPVANQDIHFIRMEFPIGHQRRVATVRAAHQRNAESPRPLQNVDCPV